jgi:hypothetical protein
VIALLLALALTTPTRSQAVRAAFIRASPPPAWCATYVVRGGRLRLYSRTGACDVDHRCPLKCGGPDSLENLQWMDAKANRSKGADCTACEVKP